MYYFIVNPNSRSGHGLHLWQEAENILKEKKIEYEVFFTEYPGHAMALSRQIAGLRLPCTLSVLGGDGTLNEVVNGLMETDFSIFPWAIFLPAPGTILPVVWDFPQTYTPV